MKICRKQSGFEDKLVSWIGTQPVYRTENKHGARMIIFRVEESP